MFLLLIFFMLSSQISPYALMPVGAAASAAGVAEQAGASTGPLAIRLSHGEARIGGRVVALENLAAAVEDLVGQGITAFVVIPTASADVQDAVTALETLQGASAVTVTLVSAGGRQ